ncbi:hypothetical protein NBZ79_14260 [Sneathiella marina]|uniref:Uncharacterized protein n=1 Tax=Sneathiella marina TaxID=2950108 RepID=A0ABY4W0D4_9PROT|nr:hypothetical protein [Sneathiella marina]USG60331.1 hypothetical protein NBZ79_14260 [Sneathiella marina]
MPAKPKVIRSIETRELDLCVDIFLRADGTYGFEQYRRDVEDRRGWFPVSHYQDQVFATDTLALATARKVINWLDKSLNIT